MKTGITLLLVGALHARLQALGADLENQLANAITNRAYLEPTTHELERAEALFRATLGRTKPAAELQTNWASLGFEFTAIAARKERFWVLRDVPSNPRGAGWYLFREKGKSLTTLQAPHARNDLGTGLIALRLFEEGDARALACSTISRRTADMAHREDTCFQAFTRAFAEACPGGFTVQFHGFDAASRQDAPGDVVASTGTRSPAPWLGEFADALRGKTGLKVLVYPRDRGSAGLGGTRNVQGRALRREPGGRFLHLELSPRVRDQLTDHQQLRRALLACLDLDHRP